MSIRIFEVSFSCECCGRILPDPGYCAACAEEIRALDQIWLLRNHPFAVQIGQAKVIAVRGKREQRRPELPQWVYGAGAALVVLLLNYIVYAFIAGGY